MKEQILFVDDDVNLLSGLRRMLRPMRDKWDVIFESNPKAAIEQMRSRCFDVVVVDMRMPEIDGAELLKEVQTLCPKSVRLVLSGQAERQSVFRAVNPAHQYLAKPCDADTLCDIIERALQLRNSLEPPVLKEGISRIETLPVVDSQADSLRRQLSEESLDIDRIISSIESDLGLASKAIKVVSSAFFGPRREVTSPAEACHILGPELLRELFLTEQYPSRLFPEKNLIFINEMAKATRNAARQIALLEERSAEETTNIAAGAYFCNVGELVLSQLCPYPYGSELMLISHAGGERTEAERTLFGATHADAGAFLLGLWGDSSVLIDSARYLQNPQVYSGPHAWPVLVSSYVRNQLLGQPQNEDAAEILKRLAPKHFPRWAELCNVERESIKSFTE